MAWIAAPENWRCTVRVHGDFCNRLAVLGSNDDEGEALCAEHAEDARITAGPATGRNAAEAAVITAAYAWLDDQGNTDTRLEALAAALVHLRNI